MMQFLTNVVKPDDRAGHELRKHCNVDGDIHKAPFHGHLPPVDVDQIGNRVEGEEGDAQWQMHVRPRP